jgi:hypothetical protein
MKIPIDQISQSMTLHVEVTGMRRWNVRMRLAVWLIYLAALVAPIRFNVQVFPEQGHGD